MKKTAFWIGVIVLVVGIVLFGYGYSTIQNIRSRFPIFFDYSIYSYYPDVRQQWDTANLLQPMGLGMLVLGAIMLAYGLWVKKESK